MESTSFSEIVVSSLEWIVMISVCVAVLGFFGYRNHARWSFGRLPLEWPTFSVISEATWLASPAIVAIVFGGIWAQTQPSLWNVSQPGTNSFVRSDPPSSGIQATSNHSQIGNPTSPRESFGNRPLWITKLRMKEGLAERMVLASGQYSTTAEAEVELLQKAGELVSQDLQHVNSMGHGGVGWRPSDDELKRFAVKQQYVEVTETDFGSFQHPMHRVWWQVELSPSVRAEFLPSWRRNVVATRIQWIGIGATSFALLASLIRVYLRMLTLMNGKHRVALAAFAAGIAAGWLLLVRLVSEGRIW